MQNTDALDALLAEQSGIVSLPQLRAAGISADTLRAQLDARRWRRVHPETIAVFTGPLPPMARIWAASLACGDEALCSHHTAAWLHRLSPSLNGAIDITVPAGHRARRLAGVRVHRSRRLCGQVEAAPAPPRTTVADTVADLIGAASDRDVVAGLISKAITDRLCTVDALTRTIGARQTMRHRRTALALVADTAGGAHSALEHRYLRCVERAHALPGALRQAVVGTARVDVFHQLFGVRVELDGRQFHRDAFRDMRRDNVALVAGEVTLRFGWADVAHRPCEVAEQVAAVLRSRGWTGRLSRCRRPSCTVAA